MGLGEKGRRIRELTSSVQKRFKFPENTVELYAEKVNNRGLCAIAQAESLRYKLLGGLVVRRYVSNLKNCAFIFCTAGSRTWINFKS
jgi:small subunit ribosomal protein S3e